VNRHGARPSVRYAIEAGLRPAVYGSGWEGVIPSQLIVAEFVPNHHLPVIYSSVGVLLNDHWDTMKAWGFVSNRIFDGLACATPIVVAAQSAMRPATRIMNLLESVSILMGRRVSMRRRPLRRYRVLSGCRSAGSRHSSPSLSGAGRTSMVVRSVLPAHLTVTVYSPAGTNSGRPSGLPRR